MERRVSTNSDSSMELADVSSSNKTLSSDANSSLAIKMSQESDNVESDENEDYLNNNTCKKNDNEAVSTRRSATNENKNQETIVRRDNLRQLMDKMLQKKIMSTSVRNNNHSSEENLNDNANGSKVEETKYLCPICEEISTTQHEFTNHIRNHNNVRDSSDDGSSFTCRICSKVLSSASSLDRHVLVHTGERPFNW